jgi:hypothetical protein
MTEKTYDAILQIQMFAFRPLAHRHLFLVKKNIPRYIFFLPETSACALAAFLKSR